MAQPLPPSKLGGEQGSTTSPSCPSNAVPAGPSMGPGPAPEDALIARLGVRKGRSEDIPEVGNVHGMRRPVGGRVPSDGEHDRDHRAARPHHTTSHDSESRAEPGRDGTEERVVEHHVGRFLVLEGVTQQRPTALRLQQLGGVFDRGRRGVERRHSPPRPGQGGRIPSTSTPRNECSTGMTKTESGIDVESLDQQRMGVAHVPRGVAARVPLIPRVFEGHRRRGYRRPRHEGEAGPCRRNRKVGAKRERFPVGPLVCGRAATATPPSKLGKEQSPPRLRPARVDHPARPLS